MPKTTNTNFFITSVLADPKADLMIYLDRKFTNELRLTIIDEIKVILLKINSEQLYSQAKGHEFNLQLAINAKHPHSGLQLLDYCVIAGFYDLATRLCYNGALCKNSDIFINNIANTFTAGDNHPEIIQDIQSVIEKMSYIKLSKSNLQLEFEEQSSKLQKIKSITQEHPFSALLFSLGAICSLASPFAHGYATVMLVSVGIPALLSSINSMQSSKGGKDNNRQVQKHDRIAYEAKEIRRLLEITNELKQDLINTKSCRYISDPLVVRTDFSDQGSTQQLLFAYEARAITPEIVSRLIENSKSNVKLNNSLGG